MGCAPTRIWRPGSLDRGVWHVSINLDTSNETHQDPPDGTQGYLVACYRNIVDTKPSHYFEAESEIRSQVESKTGKKRNGPNRKSNRLTKKKIHIPWATLNNYLGWLMWCKVCISYESFYTNNGAAKIQSAVRYFRPNESALYKLCTNINQPYLIWDAVLCRHVPSPKDQGYHYQQSNRPKRGYV